eukprot:9504043-Pyramimonas_sp.AAC.4
MRWSMTPTPMACGTREILTPATPNGQDTFTYSLPRLCLEGFLLALLKGAGQCNTPRAVPPASAPRFSQLRQLS